MKLHLFPLVIFSTALADTQLSSEAFAQDVEAVKNAVEALVVGAGATKSAIDNNARLSPKEKVQLEKLQKDYMALLNRLENLKLSYQELQNTNQNLQQVSAQKDTTIQQLQDSSRRLASNIRSLQNNYFERLKDAKNTYDAQQATLENQLNNQMQELSA